MIAALLVAASLVGQHSYDGVSLPDTFHAMDSLSGGPPVPMTWDNATQSWLSPGNTYQLADVDGLRFYGFGGVDIWVRQQPYQGLPITFVCAYGWQFWPPAPLPHRVITLVP